MIWFIKLISNIKGYKVYLLYFRCDEAMHVYQSQLPRQSVLNNALQQTTPTDIGKR